MWIVKVQFDLIAFFFLRSYRTWNRSCAILHWPQSVLLQCTHSCCTSGISAVLRLRKAFYLQKRGVSRKAIMLSSNARHPHRKNEAAGHVNRKEAKGKWSKRQMVVKDPARMRYQRYTGSENRFLWKPTENLYGHIFIESKHPLFGSNPAGISGTAQLHVRLCTSWANHTGTMRKI